MPGLDYNLLKEDVHEDDDLALYHPYESDDSFGDEDIEYDTDEVNDTVIINQFSENSVLNASDTIASLIDFSTSTAAYISSANSLRNTQSYGEENLISREINSEVASPSPGFPVLQEPIMRNDDYYNSLGNSIAQELRAMDSDQAEIAERLINRILHEAQMGRLTANTGFRTT